MNQTATNIEKFNFFDTIYKYAGVVVVLIFVFGALLNLFILYIFLSDRGFQKTTYKLFLVSVISDIMSTATSMIGYSQIIDQRTDYYGGKMVCSIGLYFLYSSYGISALNLCIIGLDRYFAIVKPFSSFYRSHKKSVIILGESLVWLVSMTLNLPFLMIITAHHNDTMLCDFQDLNTTTRAYLVLFSVVFYVIPTISIAIIYSKIIAFQQSYVRPGEFLGYQRRIERTMRRRFIRMLCKITSCYILLAWPNFATLIGIAITGHTIIMIRQESTIAFFFLFFSITTTTSISILNPIIYLKYDIYVRIRAINILKQILNCRCKKHHRSINLDAPN
ncbi:Neuropeptide CCHamide-1 receptor [Trichoplax sp. H2]|nr:Neuropeptide CCHamide-1 receptor [Trichoplax sp. H2]|eukprot:RDD41373.1 Neuropeptide CCHamide-1 receptor [Trichoplax sp. H2]